MSVLEYGRMIMPAIRIDREGLETATETARRQVESVGPAGFIIFGGQAEAVAVLTADLRARAGRPLLFGADLERGAGQQFAGLTELPTPMAIAACPEAEVLARLAGETTAREALSVGVNLVFAPVCDVNTEARNPIINVRGFSNDAERVARLAAAWIAGAQACGGLCCAKHFPGHGAAVGDSHLELPAGVADKEELLNVHLAPFRAAIGAGVSAIMTAHITVPALGETGAATMSMAVVGDLLREELGFTGLVITDALIMSGIGVSEEEAAVRALKAGCDLLLYPSEPEKVKAALEYAQLDLRLKSVRHAAVRQRLERGSTVAPAQVEAARRIAQEAVTLLDGAVRRPERFLILCDNERLDPEPFRRVLRAAGLTEVTEAATGDPALVVAVFSFPAAWRGTSGPLPETVARIPQGCGVVSFGDPYFLRELNDTAYRIAAYDPAVRLQETVAEKLLAGGTWPGRLPIS